MRAFQWVATIADAVAMMAPAGHASKSRAILGVRVRLARSPPVLGYRSRRPAEASRHAYERGQTQRPGRMQVKGSQKPKKLGKKPAQKTLKERRTAKRAAAKQASRSLDV